MMKINPFEVMLAEMSPNVITYYVFLKTVICLLTLEKQEVPYQKEVQPKYIIWPSSEH